MEEVFTRLLAKSENCNQNVYYYVIAKLALFYTLCSASNASLLSNQFCVIRTLLTQQNGKQNLKKSNIRKGKIRDAKGESYS